MRIIPPLPVTVRPATPAGWLTLRLALWPGEDVAELRQEMSAWDTGRQQSGRGGFGKIWKRDPDWFEIKL